MEFFWNFLNSFFLLISLSAMLKGAELYDSVTKLENSLTYVKFMSHSKVSKNIQDSFISREEQRLKKLKEVAESNDAKELEKLLASNDLNGENAYTTFQFFSKSTNFQQKMREAYLESMQIKSHLREDVFPKVLLPSEEDLKGATIGILKLQNMYSLSPDDIIKGNMGGHQSRPLTADEALDIVRYTQDVKLPDIDLDRLHLAWLISINNSLTVHDKTNLVFGEVLKMMSYIFLKANCVCNKESVRVFEQMKAIDSQYATTLAQSMASCTQPLSATKCRLLEPGSVSVLDKDLALCKELVSFSADPKLKCEYQANTDHGKAFQSTKYERVRWESPFIAVWHNFASATDIDHIKRLGVQRLFKDIQTHGKNRNKSCIEISVSGKDLQKLAGVQQLITKLESEAMFGDATVRQLQLTNCGVGGINTLSTDSPEHDGMNYALFLADGTEEISGIFPDLGVRLHMSTGSLLMFEQTIINGTDRVATKFQTCPVLHGNVWSAAVQFNRQRSHAGLGLTIM